MPDGDEQPPAQQIVNVQADQSGKIPMPNFTGVAKSNSALAINAESFLTCFNQWARACGYTDERKANTFINALSDEARDWYMTTIRRKKVEANNWNQVLREFRTRFIKSISPHYIAGEFNKLHQRPTETVAVFADRCYMAQTLLDDIWDDEKVEDLTAAQRVGYKQACTTVSDQLVLQHFLRHIKPELYDKLSVCQNLESLTDHIKAAEKIEATSNEKKSATISAVSIEHMSAVATRQRQQPQRKQQQPAKKPPPSTYVCRLCGIKGHYIYECKLSNKVKNGNNGPRQQQAPRHLGLTPRPPQQGQSPQQNQWQPKQFPINKASPIEQQPVQQQYQQCYPNLQPVDEYQEQQMASLRLQGIPQGPQNWPTVNQAFQH